MLNAGSQHGVALVSAEAHVTVTSSNPDYPEDTLPIAFLPVDVEARTFGNEVVSTPATAPADAQPTPLVPRGADTCGTTYPDAERDLQ